MHIPLKKGDDVTIHFKSPEWPLGYASCTYSGQRNGKHMFIAFGIFLPEKAARKSFVKPLPKP